MLNLFGPLLDELASAQPDFTPHRYGLVAACDGGLLEVSGLSVPVGALCRVVQETGREARGDMRGEPLAEVIGFRNGRTMMMLLGDTVLLRPGALVRPEGHPGMLPVGEVITLVLKGDGNCAKIDAANIGISLPGWTLIAFGVLALYALLVPKLARRHSIFA